ncbi:MAG: DUF423 domain-containing protein [Cytophagales bacterium]|nr:MAG: DUF423 domain-containing protein [Cytophagales bacterium]
MNKNWFLVGCILMALTVALGAFGAHGLKNVLVANQRMDTFETGIKYQFYHVFGILIACLVASQVGQTNLIEWACWLFLVGIIVFSGSLYVLSLTNIRWLGAITPLGGVCFIAGWVSLGLSIRK